MRTDLKPHNKTAYQKIMKAFETSDRTCVCHPTGTGKSYIVAAVCEHFKKVIIIAPNYFVLRQQKSILGWHKGVDYRTYPGLLDCDDVLHEKYDLVVLDEFHRAGAPEWQRAVNGFIESQPQAKLLGTSATHIRHLDGERNMADELFGGNIASEMSIADAWSRGVLPVPSYVTGYFRFDKMVSEATERIQNLKLSEEKKRQRIFRLSNKKLDWEKSMGMPRILQKHLPKDVRRIVVFCSHIDELDEMKKKVEGWMKDAGFKVAESYIIHGHQADSIQDKAMQAFEDNAGNGVKLMFSVNILNEGVHVPNVGAVIMLRTTSSRNIFMQQMGRALTTANTEKPVVLDMVDNITTTDVVKAYREEFEHFIEQKGDHSSERPKFEVYDYRLGVKQLIEKLTRIRHYYTKEERKAIILPWIKEHGRTPRHGVDMDVYCHWVWLKTFALDDEEVYNIYKTYAPCTDLETRVELVCGFYEEMRRLPQRNAHNKEEKRLGAIWQGLVRKSAHHPKVESLQKRNNDDKRRNRDERIRQRVEVCERILDEGGKPADVRKTKEYELIKGMNLKNHPLVKKFKKRLGKGREPNKTVDEWVDVFEELMKRKGRALMAKDGSVYTIWAIKKRENPDHPRIKKLQEMYKPVEHYEGHRSETYRIALDFYHKNGRMMLPSDDRHLYNRIRTFINKYPDDFRVQELIRLKQQCQK